MATLHNTQSATRRPNRFIEGQSLAVLLCPAPKGATVAVTIDREDLQRTLAAGFWRVGIFPAGLYCYASRSKGNTYLHRFILNARKGQVVDHKKHRTLDNRKSEIRLCTQGLNQLNRNYGGHGISGHRGVHFKRGKWRARVQMDNRYFYLGTFTDPAEAGKAVQDFIAAQGVTL